MTNPSGRIDLHMHSTVSDGSDTPEELFSKIKAAGIEYFSVTDHDALKATETLISLTKNTEFKFIPGVEFSCRDDGGKYHILGYGYDPAGDSINKLVERSHNIRMKKVTARIELLEKEFGIIFPPEEISALLSLDNPGKPHIGNLMTKLGYTESKEEALEKYVNRLHFKSEYIDPGTVIEAILSSNGIPVLAHPFYGSGDEQIFDEAIDKRLQRLVDLGIKGIEACYSLFTPKLVNQALMLANRYDLYVTAGSDYHGKNKKEDLGETGLVYLNYIPERLERFLKLFF